MNTTVDVVLETATCCDCGIVFGLPVTYKRSLRETHRGFFCPNGHSLCYPGESESEKLRQELKRKEQELADMVRQKIQAANQLRKTNTRIKHGVCSCCNRTFKHLAAHMKNKHPNFKP